MSDHVSVKSNPQSGTPQDGIHRASSSPCGHAHHQDINPELETSALVSMRGVTITRQGRDLVHDVALDIWPNEIVTLIGPNGAGKTTLIKALLGLEPLSRGKIFKRKGLSIGYVPQKFAPDPALPLTVGRFLGLGLALRAEANIAKQTLDEVGAAHVFGHQMHQVSGGELQRILLARALLRKPELLVLDEPAQGVDLAGEVELYDLISSLASRYAMSVLLVSHDLHTVMARSNRVICLNHHVCCSGVPDRVSQHPEYERLFGSAAAKSLAVYRHHHDHHHDLSGEPAEGSKDPAENGT